MQKKAGWQRTIRLHPAFLRISICGGLEARSRAEVIRQPRQRLPEIALASKIRRDQASKLLTLENAEFTTAAKGGNVATINRTRIVPIKAYSIRSCPSSSLINARSRTCNLAKTWFILAHPYRSMIDDHPRQAFLPRFHCHWSRSPT